MTNATVFRNDYQAYPYQIDSTQLEFELHPEKTLVKSKLQVTQLAEQAMYLNGEDLDLVSLTVNGVTWPTSDYEIKEKSLIINNLPKKFELEIHNYCFPERNTTLMGLYISNGTFFTQCEAEGFRRITYYPDRPDVLSRFRVTLISDNQTYPVQLSNGNLVQHNTLENGTHVSVWEDPFPKPSYLFAIVAGSLAVREERITTQQGKEVLLQIYSAPHDVDKTEHAMASLIRSIRWDEKVYGLHLDLERFMIVATHDFNMGAMENKGLNIFNAAYVLADPSISTDSNFADIEAVVGHEYFHNWTGNRVTCRDWFQLSLKEGLTVFRDQSFSADMLAQDLAEEQANYARSVKRIDDVMTLRAAQFPEDAGPMAHPIRPESYQEIGNFYTATVYEKGAEVIRMLHTILGPAGFRQGMDEYIKRHDGQAVTCDDFINAMEFAYTQEHPTKNLEIFRRWYSQAGTPEVDVFTVYDEQTKTLKLSLEQRCEPVGIELKQASLVKKPFHIPFKLGMLNQQGHAITATCVNTGQTLETHQLDLTMAYQSWTFTNVNEEPILSLLRDFSAPVHVKYHYEDSELATLLAYDSNAFARWEAGQIMAKREIFNAYDALIAKQDYRPSNTLTQAYQHVLEAELDPAYTEKLLNLPNEKTLVDELDECDPIALFQARRLIIAHLGKTLSAHLLLAIERCSLGADHYSSDPISAGKRALKNTAWSYLLAGGQTHCLATVRAQFKTANNMTDRMGALSALTQFAKPADYQDLLSEFYDRFKTESTVIDKWLSLQACSPNTTAQAIRELMTHKAFTLKTPNRVRALLFQFCINNPSQFHGTEGYQLWSEVLLQLDALNPEVAARFARIFDRWSLYKPAYKTAMYEALINIQGQPELSSHVAEIIQKALEITHEA